MCFKDWKKYKVGDEVNILINDDEEDYEIWQDNFFII